MGVYLRNSRIAINFWIKSVIWLRLIKLSINPSRKYEWVLIYEIVELVLIPE